MKICIPSEHSHFFSCLTFLWKAGLDNFHLDCQIESEWKNFHTFLKTIKQKD